MLAHAERYEPLMADHNAAGDWLGRWRGVADQCGQPCSALFGKPSMEAAWDWLSSGWISVVATDSHGTGSRRPRMEEAIDLIAKQTGRGDLRKDRPAWKNPAKILLGEDVDLL